MNASAGSGKTYNLVRNYLRLLLSEGDEKAELGQIIAMTFTNKAALEMKTRIVSDLNKLANAKPEHQTYLKDMASYIGLPEQHIQQNARVVLKKMLHQYEDFNVLTIDKFNLKLIRSFSRDLNLPEQFEVVLDEQLILEKAIDELLNTIDEKEQNRLYQLAINYAKSNLEEEDRWNIKKALLNSASILTNEQSFAIVKQLTEAEFTEEDLKIWKLELKTLLTKLSLLQRDVQISLDASGLSENDFVYKKETFNRLKAMCFTHGNFSDLNDAFTWSNRFVSSIEKTGENTGQQELVRQSERLMFFWGENKTTLLTLELKTKQFYLLSVLRELALSMENIRQKEAVIRISEFNQLVAELVRDEEAPFIYERLGTRFGHFFLDEFQDTSRLQWTNLVPLVHESLGQNQFNFIVGDPKQSIYRFKNGVAEQFVVLPRIYNPEGDANLEMKSDFFEAQGKVVGLEENWRSAKEIVRFNNAFFTQLLEKLPEEGKSHYNQITQEPRGKDNGLLVFHLEKKDADKPENALIHLTDWVAECLQDGYSPGDICILAKRKKECNLFANHLKKQGYSVVSSDSLLVNSDLNVQLVQSFLKWRSNPSEMQYAMHFAEMRFRLQHLETAFELYECCFEVIEIEGKTRRVFSPSHFFEKSGFDPSLLEVGYQNLYSLIQLFLRSEKMDELQNAYLHQLLDIAFQFDLANGPDLLNFLNYYETKGKDTNVQLPENRNSIKIMTAHKSKGLEFPVVIIPSLNFDSTSPHKNPRLVAAQGHFIETKFTKAEAQLAEIAPLKEQEDAATVMDGVNLLYVAFTRPVDRLYLYGAESKSSKLMKDIHSILAQLYPETVTEHSTIEGRIGKSPEIEHSKVAESNNFIAHGFGDFLWFPEISLQSNEEEERSALNKQKRLGKQFHSLMENGNDEASALTALQIGIQKGTVEVGLKDELAELIREVFSQTTVVSLLQSGIHLDERTLALDEKTRLRPDKIVVSTDTTVVIDFKTGEQKPEHLKQVSDYAFALNEIGYPRIEGYLYYAGGAGLVKVNLGMF